MLYGVQTKTLNQAIKRNKKRFPSDFMFQLTKEESDSLRSQIVTLKRGGHSKYLPHAFTEQGVAMLSGVLNSDRAIEINIQIMRAFVRLRQIVADNEALRYAIEGLERRVGKNERDIQIALRAMHSLLNPPISVKPKKKIGFGPPER